MREKRKTLDKKSENLKLKRIAKKQKLQERGITLIALVVTIIILLILAGVSISMVVGENAIINKTLEASKKTDEAERKEKAELDKVSELIDETISGKQTVEQVKDEYPGKLEEVNGEKVINSIEDLVVFADDVTNEKTFENDTVKLGLSLDFNSSKSYVEPYRKDYGKYGYNGELKTLLTTGEGFKPIGVITNEEGYENKSFKGTFDGNGNIIKNLYINLTLNDDENDLRIGLFGNNYGTIKKIGLTNCNISGKLESESDNSVMAGGICGKNFKEITDCFVSGELLAVGVDNGKTYIGGVCGNNAESIMDCFNLANISSEGDNCVTLGRYLRFGGY